MQAPEVLQDRGDLDGATHSPAPRKCGWPLLPKEMWMALSSSLFDAEAVVRRDLLRYRPHGSRTSRRISLHCVEKRDR